MQPRNIYFLYWLYIDWADQYYKQYIQTLRVCQQLFILCCTEHCILGEAGKIYFWNDVHSTKRTCHFRLRKCLFQTSIFHTQEIFGLKNRGSEWGIIAFLSVLSYSCFWAVSITKIGGIIKVNLCIPSAQSAPFCVEISRWWKTMFWNCLDSRYTCRSFL